jgi:hypothetical protein
VAPPPAIARINAGGREGRGGRGGRVGFMKGASLDGVPAALKHC